MFVFPAITASRIEQTPSLATSSFVPGPVTGIVIAEAVPGSAKRRVAAASAPVSQADADLFRMAKRDIRVSSSP
jgi:hypothetical protein